MKLLLTSLVALLVLTSSAKGQRLTSDRIADRAQTINLRRLRASSSMPLKISLDRGAVRFATFNVRVPARFERNSDTKASWFLNQFKGALRLKDPGVELQLSRPLTAQEHTLSHYARNALTWPRWRSMALLGMRDCYHGQL